jgi:hypothetical protein
MVERQSMVFDCASILGRANQCISRTVGLGDDRHVDDTKPGTLPAAPTLGKCTVVAVTVAVSSTAVYQWHLMCTHVAIIRVHNNWKRRSLRHSSTLKAKWIEVCCMAHKALCQLYKRHLADYGAHRANSILWHFVRGNHCTGRLELIHFTSNATALC